MEKNYFIEKYLLKLNNALVDVEKELAREIKGEPHPPIFIVGAQRSGTTLLNQLIINNFALSYPSNFIARYWKAPLLGTLLSQNLNIEKKQLSYVSNLGRTKELHGPHEFNYFWRRWFPRDKHENGAVLNFRDKIKLKNELNALSAFTEKSWLFKNLHCVPFNMSTIMKICPNALFVFIKRNILYNVQSTIESRINLFGDINEWFGPKPKSYIFAKSEDPIEEIVKQVFFINKEIEDDLKNYDKKNVFSLYYESLTSNPSEVLNELSSFLKKAGINRENEISYDINDIKSGNKKRLNGSTFKKIESIVKTLYNAE